MLGIYLPLPPAGGRPKDVGPARLEGGMAERYRPRRLGSNWGSGSFNFQERDKLWPGSDLSHSLSLSPLLRVSSSSSCSSSSSSGSSIALLSLFAWGSPRPLEGGRAQSAKFKRQTLYWNKQLRRPGKPTMDTYTEFHANDLGLGRIKMTIKEGWRTNFVGFPLSP